MILIILRPASQTGIRSRILPRRLTEGDAPIEFGVGEFISVSADGAGAFEQHHEGRGDHGVAAVDQYGCRGSGGPAQN